MNDRWLRLENLLDGIGIGVHPGEEVAFRRIPCASAAPDLAIGIGKTGQEGLASPLTAGVTGVGRIVNGIRDADERPAERGGPLFHKKSVGYAPGGHAFDEPDWWLAGGAGHESREGQI